jgi:flagellar hook-associated protein 3 FlgL
MTSSLTRLGSANTYDNALRNLSRRQSALSNLQENLTSGKKVVRASDDPTGAAQAERAMTRISRIATDQRALEAQRNSIAMAEGTLGDVTDALQNFRELVVSAGSGVHSSAERKSIAIQLQSLRDQVFSLANRKDSTGQPLFPLSAPMRRRRTTPLTACPGNRPAAKLRFRLRWMATVRLCFRWHGMGSTTLR